MFSDIIPHPQTPFTPFFVSIINSVSIQFNKVKSINPRMARVAIVCVGQIPVKDPFRGIIRLVRAGRCVILE